MRRLLLLSFIWGWSFLFIKVAGEGMTPTTVAGLRVGFGALVLVVVLHGRGERIPMGRRLWRDFAIAAVFGNAIPFTLLAFGEERISSGLTAVLNASTPMFTAIAAAVYLHERLRPVQVAGLAIGFVGVAVAAGVGAADIASSSLVGGLSSVAAGASYGIAFAFMRRHLTSIPPLSAATGQLVVASIMMAPFAITTSIAHGFDPTPTRILAIVLLGVVGTGLAYVINYRLIADLGATKAALSTYIIPVVAVIVGVIALDEEFTWQIVAGGLLIACGIAAVHRPVLTRRPRVPTGSTPAVLVLVVALALVGCGDGVPGGGGGPCEATRTEELDPNSNQHVLPNAPPPEYLSDPPTSGPHQPSRELSGVVDEEIPAPVQVGLLEVGGVLIQYDADLEDATLADLADLDPVVVVAPNDDLPEPVVATAWRHKMVCSEASLADLRDFVAEFAGRTAADH
jgi:drug/metabolite transporter (DMT)-like permease